MVQLESRVSKFIELAEYLYRNGWVHFMLSDGNWTERLEGEERIFGIVIRTLLCNDTSSEKFFTDIGGLEGTEAVYNNKDVDFVHWLSVKLKNYKMGSGKGSHRDGRHKRWTPKGIKGYLELTEFKQRTYLDNVRGYNVLFNDLVSVYSVGPLTAFDITKRFYEAGVIEFLPDRFYLTGSGEVKGLRALFPSVKNDGEFVKKGDFLVKTIIERTGISEEVAYFGVEDLLCIYQKDKRYEKFLKGRLSVRDYGSVLLDKNCTRERGVC